ncbi:MAG: alanine/glycine:cation symporter family protein [Oscillospiraceae bacterium]|nr:alanine/glycine:cation symporter family protein [Oscillospiraceae bacterium]
MDKISQFVKLLDDALWGLPMIVILFGTHLFMTYKTGFIQRKTFKGIKLSVTKDPDSPGDVSQFQALTTALASTIGTGNIIGVGTAIFIGGPGAVFWCWLTGVFGIATKYAESLIAVKYRVKTKEGRMLGGAMYALERGLNMKWLGIMFALCAAFASFGIGSSTQINAITEVVENNITFVSIPRWSIGVFFAAVTAVVIIGGIKSISKVCEKLVPIMAIFYVAGCLIILFMNHDYIGQAVSCILKLAFTPGAVGGGLVGQGILIAARYGIARGLFSNESGMGSAPLVASAAKTKNPVRQALVSSTGTFWDTVVVCLLTGLMLVSTILKNPDIDMASIENGGQLTTAAFSQIPVLGPVILVIGIIAFAYSTTLGWSYYGEQCIEYLFGQKGILPYKIVFIFTVAIASVASLDLVWDIANILNGLMAIPNLAAVILLSNVIKSETDKYINDLDKTDDTPIPVVDK